MIIMLFKSNTMCEVSSMFKVFVLFGRDSDSITGVILEMREMYKTVFLVLSRAVSSSEFL